MPTLVESHPFKPDVWDRFIRNPKVLRQRYHCCTEEFDTEESKDAIMNEKLYSRSEETYKELLAKALSVNIVAKKRSPMWSVRPRNNPFVNSPCAILDLPNFGNNFCSSLMDWSSTDYLTVAFPSSVYLWYAPSNNTTRFPVSNTNCVKWTRDGKYLFTASRRGSYKVSHMDFQNNPTINGKSSCHINCFITSCSFHPFEDILLTGCSKGAFSLYSQERDKSVTLLFYQQDFEDSITSVEFSCDGKHFAVSSVSGKVGVYATLYKNVLCFIRMAGPVRGLCWHPWERSSLVVADCLGNMNLYDVFGAQKPKASYTSLYQIPIVGLAFNPLSAELVVSHTVSGSLYGTPYQGTQLSVLASFDRVVERLEGHTGRVLGLSWNPDGTRLASCGSDETARIWNFLPQNRKYQFTQKKSVSNSTSTITKLENRLGLALR